RKPKFKITPGQVVTVALPEPEATTIEPEPIPLDIRYEDADVIVLNKPAGMVVHPAPGHPRGTLVNALLHHSPEIDLGGSNRPGIVHRLDKDTSGLMVVAKSDRARGALLRQWAERSVTKRYLALVHGVVEPEEGTIDAPVGRDPLNRQRMAVVQNGRPAVTHFKVLRRFANATLLELDLESGRTHQVRVHLAFIGHPIVGDAIYGANPHAPAVAAPRQFLHASRLAFMLPDGEPVSLASALPSDLQAVLDRLIDEEAAAARGR
ncbi:MAG TPA: RluA family pseudouridine synthase, partial [Thermomicrobiales bacterium]|nr:RluA family pseudouridine synthase [Thermomicrobiales bacterium]